MTATIIRRLASLPSTLLVTSMLMFFVMAMGPSPLAQMQEFANLTPEDMERISEENGWNDPLLVQYAHWAGNFVTGDLGTSLRTLQPAGEMIMERLPLTLTISAAALLLSLGIGLPLGVLLAVRRHTKLDTFTTIIMFVLMALPGFFTAIALQMLAVSMRERFGTVVVYAGGLPDGGGILELMQYLTLPILTLAIAHIAMWARYQRGELLGVLTQEYIRSARAKGIPEKLVLARHAMRNAVLPIVTIVAIDLGKLIAGAVIVETVFALPGIGTLLLDSVSNNDTIVALDVLMIIAAMMVISNMLADIAYGALDPRVRER